MDQHAGGVAHVPIDEWHRLHAVEREARLLHATLDALLHADPEGGRHTAACHARRRAGLPGCSSDCRLVRTALYGDGAVDPRS